MRDPRAACGTLWPTALQVLALAPLVRVRRHERLANGAVAASARCDRWRVAAHLRWTPGAAGDVEVLAACARQRAARYAPGRRPVLRGLTEVAGQVAALAEVALGGLREQKGRGAAQPPRRTPRRRSTATGSRCSRQGTVAGGLSPPRFVRALELRRQLESGCSGDAPRLGSGSRRWLLMSPEGC